MLIYPQIQFLKSLHVKYPFKRITTKNFGNSSQQFYNRNLHIYVNYMLFMNIFHINFRKIHSPSINVHYCSSFESIKSDHVPNEADLPYRKSSSMLKSYTKSTKSSTMFSFVSFKHFRFEFSFTFAHYRQNTTIDVYRRKIGYSRDMD